MSTMYHDLPREVFDEILPEDLTEEARQEHAREVERRRSPEWLAEESDRQLKYEMAAGVQETETEVLPPNLPPVTWQIRLPDGGTRTATTAEELIPDILGGAITGDQPCRRILPPQKDGKATDQKWAPVANTIGESSFETRVLFRPIWAHALRGGEIGFALGFTLWLGMNVFNAFSAALTFAGYHTPEAHRVGTRFLAYGIVASYWLVQSLPLVANAFRLKWMQELAAFAAPRAFQYTAICIGLLLLNSGAPDAVLGGLFPGMGSAFGSMIAGGIAGGAPGMTMGTIVGLLRAPGLATAPASPREKRSILLLTGIALPLAVLALGVTVYVRYADDLVKGVVEAFVK